MGGDRRGVVNLEGWGAKERVSVARYANLKPSDNQLANEVELARERPSAVLSLISINNCQGIHH